MSSQLFVTCQETLEELLATEIHEMGIEGSQKGFCGVFVPYSMENIYKINYLSRIGGRVLFPLASFPCKNKAMLYDAVRKINFQGILSPEKSFAIDVNGKNPSFDNTFYATQVTKDAICDTFRDRAGKRPSIDTKSPDVQLHLFLERDRAHLSLDTSGDPLFKRGYRKECVEAPLQESLAAAILRLSGYSKEDILLDPTCGSGTIVIEAAMIASATPPGFLRQKWGFFNHPSFSKEAWLTFKNEVDSKRVPLEKNKFFGFDINRDAIRIATTNARSLEFQDFIQFIRIDFRDEWPLVITPNLMITNPPHGTRLGITSDLTALYRSMGDAFKQKIAKPGKAFLFTSSLELSKEVGLKPKKRHILKMSGQECRLLEFNIYSGQLQSEV